MILTLWQDFINFIVPLLQDLKAYFDAHAVGIILTVSWTVFGIYLIISTRCKKQTIVLEAKKEVEPLVEYKQKPIKIANIEAKPKFTEGDVVENGIYLEIDQNYFTSNRTVVVKLGILPRLANPSNNYVEITAEEKDQLTLAAIDFTNFNKKTPGSFSESGYYAEVDLENKSTEYYIYTEKRLPPTKAKGYRWVKVENRKILS